MTYEDLASPLDELITAAESARNHRARIGAVECKVTVYPGFQICPWAPDANHAQCVAGRGVRHASSDWRIGNLRIRQEVRGPGLIVHLIRDHHFFEGLNSPYRVDPRKLASVLEL